MEKVAIYCRLSEEDRNKKQETDDSNSIQNQKAMLLEYSIQQGWEVYNIYSDDNYTGSDRNRPEFKRLLDDAEAHKFDIVLCKSQSRFTRELELVEKYINGLFPIWGIRFISLVDNADTANKGNKKSRQINGLVNEWYLEDMSENIRAVLTNRRKNGFHIGAFALYGYQKDPEQKGHLIIDEEAAAIVREVFTLFSQGYGKTAIARMLNERGVPNPTEYKRQHGLRYQQPKRRNSTLWKYFAISDMLTNEIYIGNMVQGKRQVVSFKTKKMRTVSPENWIVVENTHEALVEKELWDRVQKRFNRHHHTVVRRTKNDMIGLFSGLIKCADCGMPLAYMRKQLKDREKGVYRCSKYNNNGSKACSSHYIDEDHISTFILNDIRNYATLAVNEREHLADKLYKALKKSNRGEMGSVKTKIKNIETRLLELNDRIKCVYEDKCTGKMPEDIALGLMKNFTDEKAELEKKLPIIKNKLCDISETESNINDWLDMISRYENITELDRETVFGLVESITVYEKDRSGENVTQEIRIEYRFIKNLLQKEKEDIA